MSLIKPNQDATSANSNKTISLHEFLELLSAYTDGQMNYKDSTLILTTTNPYPELQTAMQLVKEPQFKFPTNGKLYLKRLYAKNHKENKRQRLIQ